MAYSCGISLICFILFWLANSDPAFAEGLGSSCEKPANCSIPNSTCNRNLTCVCNTGFVADSKNKTCLQVAHKEGQPCEESVQCASKEKTDQTEESEDNKTSPAVEGSPCSNGSCTTPAEPNINNEYVTISKRQGKEERERLQEKHSGGSNVVPILFLAGIWIVHLVM